MKTRRLFYRAPHRATVSTENGLYFARPWTEADVAECLKGGGWFWFGFGAKQRYTSHEFVTSAALKLALVGSVGAA